MATGTEATLVWPDCWFWNEVSNINPELMVQVVAGYEQDSGSANENLWPGAPEPQVDAQVVEVARRVAELNSEHGLAVFSVGVFDDAGPMGSDWGGYQFCAGVRVAGVAPGGTAAPETAPQDAFGVLVRLGVFSRAGVKVYAMDQDGSDTELVAHFVSVGRLTLEALSAI